ncbi:MAG: hypothetical protein K0S39_863 [Paenibacillus sp.]|jgi:hypothetical protein|nr:hypothetical protein [Paenibacillus sp.]
MSYTAKTVFYFSLYMFVLGLTLLLVPEWLAPILGFMPDSEAWIRVIGMFIVLLAFYYCASAVQGIERFFPLTVYARASIILFMAVFVSLGILKPVFLLLALIDLGGAIWTFTAWRASGKQK